MDISIIIPFINEEDNIPRLKDELNKFARSSNLKYEIIFIDDGSTDNSVMMLSDWKTDSSVKIIRFSKNYGSHSALRAGVLNCCGKYITFVYADLQDPLELIHEMYNHCENGSEIIWGVRRSLSGGKFEKLFTQLYAKLIQKFVNPIFPENGFDVVMFNSKVKAVLNDNIENNSSIFLQILNLGFKQKFIYYDKSERKFGKSKWTLNKKFKLFTDSFVAFSYAPIRFVTIMGILFFFLGLFWTVYIILREIFVGDLSPGWPALISILLIGFGISNVSLGIIAEYLWRTLDAARKRPVFLIDEIIELSNSGTHEKSPDIKSRIYDTSQFK